MILTIQLPPEIESGLREQARAEGIAISDYVQNLVRGQVLARIAPDFSREAHELSMEKRRQNLRAWLESHAQNLITLPDEAMERESIYGDRGR